MWIFARKGFLSIVKDRNSQSYLLVRSRFEGDIETIFPEVDVQHTPDADYAYRAFISKCRVARRIATLVEDIDYPNFKNSIADTSRYFAYSRVWSQMARAQGQMAFHFPGGGELDEQLEDGLVLCENCEEITMPWDGYYVCPGCGLQQADPMIEEIELL